jgi:hypothetical protein
MIRFLVSTTLYAGIAALYLRWGGDQVRRQMTRMQDAAFNTPGTEAPIPPTVFLSGILVFSGQTWFASKVLKLGRVKTVLSLLIGSGVGLMIIRRDKKEL